MGDLISTACYRELGAELRKIREAAGLTEAELSDKLGWSTTRISRSEHGYVHLSEIDVIVYLAFCGVYGIYGSDQRAMCREAEPKPGHWVRRREAGLPNATRSLIYHETTAAASTSYEPEFIPGLLQTEGYIRAATVKQRLNNDIELAVRVRKERQWILTRPRPARFTFYVHEHAVRMEVGGDEVMHEQLLALLLLDGLPNVHIRVVPASVGFGGAFRVLQYAQHQPLVYLDCAFGGLFLEDREYVDSYRDLVLTIADIALDEPQSREYIADLANDYDRERARPDVHDNVEEKQL
jgi:transcriptional regulator with XRE-family HTH domain